MDPANLSANWKSLQKTLQNDDKLKRKPEANTTITIKKTIRRRSKSTQHFKATTNVESQERPSTSFSNHDNTAKPCKNEGVSSTALPGKYIALDCEMVGVGPPPYTDNQLARVSLVNYHGEQVYDSFVLPQLEVKDYRTAVSGIRPQDLAQGRPYNEVREDVITFLKGRILVGHWLKNDLECLQYHHSRHQTRDTAKLPKFRRLVEDGGGVKLKDMAKKILGVDVQISEHDSVEDARTAMMLFKATRESFDGEEISSKVFQQQNIDDKRRIQKRKLKRKNKKK